MDSERQNRRIVPTSLNRQSNSKLEVGCLMFDILDHRANGHCRKCIARKQCTAIRHQSRSHSGPHRTGLPTTFLIGLLILSGCDGRKHEAPTSDVALTVAVSIPPQRWLLDQIGGEHVHIVTVLRPGQSPAAYLPSQSEVTRIMSASIYFRIGVPLENAHWFTKIEDSKRLTIVDLREGIKLRHIGAIGHDHNGKDPHIWLNPRLLKIQAATVARELGRFDPQHNAVYQANLSSLIKRLDQLDAAIRKKLASSRQKTMFVFHPAWGYFADEYGLRQIAVESEGKPPSERHLTELHHQIERESIKVLFVQPQIGQRIAQEVAGVLDLELKVLDPLARNVGKNLLEVAKLLSLDHGP